MILRKKGLRLIAAGVAAAVAGAGILALGEYVAFARTLAARDASADRIAEACETLKAVVTPSVETSSRNQAAPCTVR